MNKKFSMVLGAACLSAALLAGCSDDSASSGASKAEECATGITSDCLLGTWSMIGFADNASGVIMPEYDYMAMPGSMVFNEDSSFVFTLPSNAAAVLGDAECATIQGTWTVTPPSLNLSTRVDRFDNMGMCTGKSKGTLTPKVAVEGSQVKMSLGQVFFLDRITDESSVKTTGTEVFTIE